MLRSFIVAGITVILFGACKEVTFKEPQPKGEKPLHRVPDGLQGSYVPIGKQTGEIADTLIITAGGFRLTGPSNNIPDEILLSDSVILMRHREYYFLNVRNQISWRLFVVKQEQNKDITHLILQEKEGGSFNEFLFSLSGQITIDSTEYNSQMYYVIDPAPKLLMDLIEKDYFTAFHWKKIR